MPKLETMKIASGSKSGFSIINACDFDEQTQKPFVKKPAKPKAKPKAKAKAKPKTRG